jgi:Mg-chelatase subunit ChlD
MARPARGKTSDIAFDATLRAAAPYQKERKGDRHSPALSIKRSDLQQKVRVRKAANLILFVVFQKDRALTVLPPTNSIQLARQALKDIPVGGKTPLSAGLLMAYELLKQEKMLRPDVLPLMILLTDGAGNVALGDLPPQDEAHRISDLIREADIRSVVINMEHAAFDQGLARALSERLAAPCYTLHELKAESLYHAVRREIDSAAA